MDTVVSDPDKGLYSETTTVNVVYNDENIRYEIWGNGGKVPESPHSVTPMKLSRFLEVIGYKSISESTWERDIAHFVDR